MTEDSLQILCVKMRRNPKDALTIKTSVCCEYMKMRIEAEKIAERLYRNNGPGHCIIFRHGFLKKDLQ